MKPEPPTIAEQAMDLARQLFPGAGEDVERRVQAQPVIAAALAEARRTTLKEVLHRYEWSPQLWQFGGWLRDIAKEKNDDL